MLDFIFNGRILRFVIGRLNPKTFIECLFLLKKIINLVVGSKIGNIGDTRNFIR